MLTRLQACDAVNEELYCLAGHVAKLELLSATAVLEHCGAGVAQLKAAVDRLASDIETLRAARIQ